MLHAQEAKGRPLDAETLCLLGAAYAGTGDVAQAVESYRAASAQSPHDTRPYIELAMLSMDHQSPAVAVGVLDAGIRSNPDSAALHTMRGSIYAQLANNDAAQKEFETADRLAPTDVAATLGLGMMLRDESNLDQAEEVLRAKLKQKPGDAVLSYLLADVLMRRGAMPGDAGFKEAEDLLQTAILRQPTLTQAHAALGKMKLKEGYTQEAIAELEKATKLDPQDRTALNQLIAAYRRSNRAQDADRVAAQLAKSVDGDRALETEKNRVHLMLEVPGASASVATPSGEGSRPE